METQSYDVALSFAGEDRAYVAQVAAKLQGAGVRVFYDEYEKVSLWGKDLYVHLHDVYHNAAEYTVMFISEHYARKLWTNHERQSAQARAFVENREYILPARFDDTTIPGLTSTVGYVDLRGVGPGELAGMIVRKVRGIEPTPQRWSNPKDAFIMHAATQGTPKLGYTVTRRRRIKELIDALPEGSLEHDYFANDPTLHRAFPGGDFNCWGVSSGAKTSFDQTDIGDLVLFIGRITAGAMIHQIGIVKAKCPVHCFTASRILWPGAPEGRLYPLLFFFDTEVGSRRWDDFLVDIGCPTFDPRGWYRRIKAERFSAHGGPAGYLRFLREECGFKQLDPPDS
jgi:hypothetical protein